MKIENTNSFESYFELGNSYKKSKDYKNALINLKKAINVNNECYLCHYTMSKIYEKLCKYEFSLFHLEKVIKIRPNFYDALFSMAQCYRKMKNEIKMLEYLKRTLAKVPEHASANHLLASMNKETRKKEVYTKLYTNNIDNFLIKNDEKFDLIIAADVFIYIGDIETIFNGIKKSISSGGYFIFTIELSSETHKKSFELNKTGRFTHTMNYIEMLCKNIGFNILESEEIILRQENMIGQKGAIFTLCKL